MGQMTIRVDDVLLVELRNLAERRGTNPEILAAELLQLTLRDERRSEWPVSRAILARGGSMSPISSVELLDQIRDEGR